MIPSARHLHAMALIMLPPAADVDYSNEYRPMVRAIAVEQGLACDWCDTDDIQSIRWAFRTFPPESDSNRYNWTQLQTRYMMGISAIYRARVAATRGIWPGLNADWDFMENEGHELYAIWDAVDDLTRPTSQKYSRRKALKMLRNLLDDDAYYSAWLPCPYPVERFEEILP